MHASELPYPQNWTKGQLLNIRNTGQGYDVTLLADEYRPDLQNGLQFYNSWDAQAFISWWYARDSNPMPTDEPAQDTHIVTPPTKRPRGRPRKHPLAVQQN